MPCRCRADAVQMPWAWDAGSARLEQRLGIPQRAATVGGRRTRAHARVRQRTAGALEACDGGVPQHADAAVREHAVGHRAAWMLEGEGVGRALARADSGTTAPHGDQSGSG